MPYLLFCQCVHSYHLHKCWNCTAVWYSCQLAAKMSCSLCYDAGKVSVVTRTVNMMIARIVTLSKKVIAIFFLFAKSSASTLVDTVNLTAHLITCDGVHSWTRTTKCYDDKATVCHIGSTVTDTKHDGGPYTCHSFHRCLEFINNMSQNVY